MLGTSEFGCSLNCEPELHGQNHLLPDAVPDQLDDPDQAVPTEGDFPTPLGRGHSPASSRRWRRVVRLTPMALAVVLRPCPWSRIARAGRRSN